MPAERGCWGGLSPLQKTALLLGVPAGATVLYILYRRYRESRGGWRTPHRVFSCLPRPLGRSERGTGQLYPLVKFPLCCLSPPGPGVSLSLRGWMWLWGPTTVTLLLPPHLRGASDLRGG